MASILKVDALQGITAAGDITVTSEGGAATQSLQQGLAKVWFHLEGDVTTATIRQGLNTSSVADNGTGDYTVSYTNSFDSHNNTLTTDAGFTQAVGGPYVVSSYYFTNQTSNRRMRSCSYSNVNSGTLTDCEQIGGSIFGDLA
jgi:hypothetical protein